MAKGSQVLRNILIRIGADSKNLTHGLNKAKKSMKNFEQSINVKKITGLMSAMNNKKAFDGFNAGVGLAQGAMASLGVAAIATTAILAKSSTQIAMDYETSLQRISFLFGKNQNDIINWANNNSTAFNMSIGEAIKYSNVYGNLLSTITSDSTVLTNYTIDLLKASAITASATGRSMEETMERIRSGLLGNTEAIEDLGISIYTNMLEGTKAFQTFAGDKTWVQLDFQTQQQIRLFGILEQVQEKFGASVYKNTSSAFLQLSAQLNNIKLRLGEAFLPMLNVVIPILSSFARQLYDSANAFKYFMFTVFGVEDTIDRSKQAIDKATASQQKLATATKEASKAAKGGLSSFDEINQLQESIAENAESAASSTTSGGMTESKPQDKLEIDVSQYQPAIDAANKLKQAYSEFFDVIKSNKDIIIGSLGGITGGLVAFRLAGFALIGLNLIPTIKGIATAMKTLNGAMIGTAATTALTTMFPALASAAAVLGISVGTLAAIIAGVILVLVALGAAIALYFTNPEFKEKVDKIWNGIYEKIKTVVNWLMENIFKPFADFISDKFIKVWNVLSDTMNWILENALKPLGNFFLKFWKLVIEPLTKAVGEALKIAFQAIGDILKSLYKNVLVKVFDFFNDLFTPAIETLNAVLSGLGKVFKIVFVDTLKDLWENILQPFGVYLDERLTPVFEAFGKVINIVWNDVLKPLAEYLSEQFVTAFDSVFESVGIIIDDVKEVFKKLLNFITDVFTGDWESAWENIKDVFKAIVDTFDDIFKAPIRLIIALINNLITRLNKLKINIPKVDIPGVGSVGGGTIGFNIPKIPELATGGIVTGPTLAMIGEAGKEAVVPLENTSFIDTMASKIGTAVLTAMQFGGQQAGGNINVNLNLNGTTLARELVPLMKNEQSRIGSAIIQGV